MRKTQGNIRSSYGTYKNMAEEAVPLNMYISIVNMFMKFLAMKVIDGVKITLPRRMGTLMLRGKKNEIRFREDGTPILPVDYAGTKKLWKDCPECQERKQIVYHTNSHTDGVSYSFHWSKKNIFVINRELYSLIMTRTNKREVNRRVMEEGKRYPVIMY